MKKIIHSYRMTLFFQRMMVIVLMLAIALPAFLQVAQKVKYYNNPTQIDYFYDALRTPAEENAMICAFQSDCLSNQRISWEGHSIYGPISGEKEEAIYFIQMEDAYFVAVQGDLANDHLQVGGIGGKVNASLKEEIKAMLIEQGVIEGVEHTFLVSPYLLKQGYVGDASFFQFWLISGIGIFSIIMGAGLLIWLACCDKAKAYRCYDRLSVREQRESIRELTHPKGMEFILLGEHLLYVRRKRNGAIHILPYRNLLWIAWDTVLYICDTEGRYYEIPCCEEAYEQLCQIVPAVLQGEIATYQPMIKQDFKRLKKEAKQNREIWLSQNRKKQVSKSKNS